MKTDLTRGLLILGTGVLMGALFSFQSKSVSQANIYYNRESRISVFKEMQIVKKSNQNLGEQVTELQKELADSNDREQALENIQKEINKDEILTGEKPAKGPGIEVKIEGELEALWFTDMTNELFSAGAEAVSVNGIRMTPDNLGFDTMPNGQVLFGGEILSSPFTFDAIGEAKTLASAMNQAGGIIARIQAYKPEYKITVNEKTALDLPVFIQGK
jgi:uncharacterized protein YlxW (UPF0749 family)